MFWNLSVMAKDPWRLALGGPRILARRTFWGVCLPQSIYATSWFWNRRVMAKDPWRLALGGPRLGLFGQTCLATPVKVLVIRRAPDVLRNA